jgi:hypothetical protein
MLTFTVEKSSPKLGYVGTSVLFQKTPKANNHPMGENSPNLATLRSKMALDFHV